MDLPLIGATLGLAAGALAGILGLSDEIIFAIISLIFLSSVFLNTFYRHRTMGFFKSLFGGASKPNRASPDGQWIKDYKAGDWTEAFTFATPTGTQRVEVATESCFVDRQVGFCILRSIDEIEGTCAYFGVAITTEINDALSIIVDRIESLGGKALKSDDWSKGRSFEESKIKGVRDTVQLIKNRARFNSYATKPPYVLVLISEINRQ